MNNLEGILYQIDTRKLELENIYKKNNMLWTKHSIDDFISKDNILNNLYNKADEYANNR